MPVAHMKSRAKDWTFANGPPYDRRQIADVFSFTIVFKSCAAHLKLHHVANCTALPLGCLTARRTSKATVSIEQVLQG